MSIHSGNGGLCHALRCTNHELFLSDLQTAARTFQILDEAGPHDQPIGDEMKKQIQSLMFGDHTRSALSHVQNNAAHALSQLQDALREVEGRFKGELRDRTEERLRRAVKNAESMHADFQELVRNYEPPDRPHEIRRNELSCLFIKGRQFVGKRLQGAYERLADSADEDLVTRLAVCVADWDRLMNRLERLREQSSRKLAADMAECAERACEIFERIADIELDAGVRGGCHYGDFGRRLRARETRAAAAA